MPKFVSLLNSGLSYDVRHAKEIMPSARAHHDLQARYARVYDLSGLALEKCRSFIVVARRALLPVGTSLHLNMLNVCLNLQMPSASLQIIRSHLTCLYYRT